MRTAGSCAMLLLVAAVFCFALAGPVEARKKIPPTGCNMQQIDANDSKLRACYAKQDDDVAKRRTYIHVVTCVAGHRYCCVQHNSNGLYTDCEKIDLVGPGSGTANPTEPPVDPGPRRPSGRATSQKPTTVSPN